MFQRLSFSSGTLLLAMVLAGTAHGKVSEEEAAKLGKELTPFGGETAGNADGTIPKWEPKWLGPVPGIEYGGPGTLRPDPYADEKPLFSITPANYKEYKDRLTEGQIALFERYETFRMDIYPTRRDFDYNPRMVEKVKWNATNTELANGVESLQHWTGSTAFPIPQGPEEVMWNMRSNHCYEAFHTIYDGYGVFANGERAHDAVDYYSASPFNNPEYPIPTTEEVAGDRVVWTLSSRLAPPRTKGQMTVVQDPLDYKADKRNAWTYDPGTRRVRKAPAIGYDNPDGPGGLQTIDDHKGFNGPFDRFTYELKEKREVYVPFHNFVFNNPNVGNLDDRLTRHHLNPDFIRYELRRVWEVEAHLAPGKRHAYKKRRWYIEEDSWNPVISENFDGRDNLWRVGMFLSDYQPETQCYEKTTQAFHDLPSGHYVANWIYIDRPQPNYGIPYMTGDQFTPAALRKAATR